MDIEQRIRKYDKKLDKAHIYRLNEEFSQLHTQIKQLDATYFICNNVKLVNITQH